MNEAPAAYVVVPSVHILKVNPLLLNPLAPASEIVAAAAEVCEVGIVPVPPESE